MSPTIKEITMLPITLQVDRNGNVMLMGKPGANQILDGSSAAAASTAISATENSVVRLASADTIYFAIGADPTATDDDIILPGGEIYIPLAPGEKVSVLGGIASLTVWG
jgi:hypothetical protein